MSASSGSDQLELPGTTAQPQPARARGLLGLALDREEFLRFLSAEWVHPAGGSRLLLGTADAYALRPGRGTGAVAVWFDVHALPPATVRAWRDGHWRETTVRALRRRDTAVAWDGPLPLFAVSHFEVESEASGVHLRALARSFADMTVPRQPFRVGRVSDGLPPADLPAHTLSWAPPGNWDALRGAAATAAYALPAIDPWIDLFCQLLRDDERASGQADALHAPWWRLGLWQGRSDRWNALPALWRAIVDELGEAGRLKEWRAGAVVASICGKALALGEDEDRVRALRAGALDLLHDRCTVDDVAAKNDDLALTLQLLVLRPTPEKFATWREDWRPIPPVVWWTGMTLAGYLQGYGSLPAEFRGEPAMQNLLALKTWSAAGNAGSGPWATVAPADIAWDAGDDAIRLLADGKPCAEHKLGTRGRWYRADFEDDATLSEARSFARTACPDALGHRVVLSDLQVRFDGDGDLTVDATSRRLSVRGRIELPLTSDVVVRPTLDVARFRAWIATASIDQPVRRPPTPASRPLHAQEPAQPYPTDVADIPTPRATGTARPASAARKRKADPPAERRATRTRARTVGVEPPQGLRLQPGFLSAAEEAQLMATLDAAPWDTRMARWVQHYGWRYDYKARKVDPKAYLGPLPEWAGALARRLLELGLVTELPDQVIVNNYVGKQGIDKHTDCADCFRGPIATVSLLETWDMVFTRSAADGTTEKFVQALPHGGAAVMDGDARSVWQHAIPPRLTQDGVPRVRRVSITFRKVARSAEVR